MEEVLKTIQTKKGGTVSLIKPDNGNPFFRYLAGAVVTTDAFRYVIRQHGQEDTATVNIQVNAPQNDQPDDQQDFLKALNGFLNCVDNFMDGSPSIMALTNLLGIDEGDVLNDDWLRSIFTNFYFFDSAKEAPEINLKDYAGQYSYDLEAGYWDFQPGGEAVLITFPSGPDAKENDATWTLKRLKTKFHKIDTDTHHLPLGFDMEMTVKGQQIFSVVADEIAYLEETAIPINANLEAVALPYVLRFKLSQENEQEFDVRCTVSDEDGCNLDLNTRWLVNQDLKQKLQGENIQLTKGEVSLNEITVTGLETLWMATQQSIYEQQKLDDLLKLNCLMAGKKIGDLKYQIREEIVELVFEDGKRLNVSDIIKEHFKQYFNAPKPDGNLRNTAFDMAEPTTHRTMARPATGTQETGTRVLNSLTEAVRKRTVKLGSNTPAAVTSITSIFKKEAPKVATVFNPGIMDSTGNIIPLIDTGEVSHLHDKVFTIPDDIMVTAADKTITAAPRTSTKTITPVKATTVKPASTDAKTATTKTITPTKTTTVKPASTKATTTKTITPTKATTVKPASTTAKVATAKTITPTKTTTVKPATTKITIKPK